MVRGVPHSHEFQLRLPESHGDLKMFQFFLLSCSVCSSFFARLNYPAGYSTAPRSKLSSLPLSSVSTIDSTLSSSRSSRVFGFSMTIVRER